MFIAVAKPVTGGDQTDGCVVNGDRRQTGIKSRDDPGCAVIGTAVLDREFNRGG